MTLHNVLVGNDLHGARAFTGTGTPVGVRTPGIVGEIYYDTASETPWIANGLTVNSWEPLTVMFTGNVVWVDAVYGDDASGVVNRQDLSFKTIQAAINAASAGDMVYIMPGTYNELITCKASVGVRGDSWQRTIISRANSVTETVVTMADDVLFQNIQILASPTAGTTTCVKFPAGTSNATSQLRVVYCEATASGGTVVGVEDAGTGTAAFADLMMQDVVIDIGDATASTGLIHSGTGTSNVKNSIIDANGTAMSATAGTTYLTTTKLVGTSSLSISSGATVKADPASVIVHVPVSNSGTFLGDGSSFPLKNIASVDPTATDDASKGYAVTSTWFNISSKVLWACFDATTGAAIWSQLASSAGAVSGPGSSTVNDIVLWNNTTGTLLKDSGKQIGAANGVATLDGSSKVVQHSSWEGVANGVATLDGSSLVVQNPTNATATPTASKIPIADGSAHLDGWLSAPTGDVSGTYPNFTVLKASTTWALTGIISPTSLSTSQNDYNPTGLSTANVVRLTASTPVNITGLSGGTTGRTIAFHNIGSNAITFTSQDAGSLAANRFDLAANLVVAPSMCAFFQYDATSSRWRLLGASRVPYGSAADTVCQGNDSRLSDSRTPTGTASGDLSGTYPSPTVSKVNGITPGSANGVATLDASSLVVQNPTNATTAPTASKIPIADTNGKLAAGWGGNANTLATLDGSSLVVQNPTNATATPTASKIPIADGSGLLNSWITVNTGDVVWVDAVNGNDGTAIKYRIDKPFLTISAAITAADAGDLIQVLPGTYNETITCKNSVSIRGLDPRQCIISRANSVSETVVTMADNMYFSNFRLVLSPSAGTTTGISFGGTTNSTSTAQFIREVASPTGTGVVVGCSISGTGVSSQQHRTVEYSVLAGLNAADTALSISSTGTSFIKSTRVDGVAGTGLSLASGATLIAQTVTFTGTTNGVNNAGTLLTDSSTTVSATFSNTGSWTASETTGPLAVGTTFSINGDISPTQITSDQNNYNPTGLSTATVLHLTSDAARSITGIIGGFDGRYLVLENNGSNPIILQHESASSTAANRFSLPQSTYFVIGPNAAVECAYDTTASRWRILARYSALANLSASADPTTSNDSTQGYNVGSLWINTSSSPRALWFCVDATATAAVWKLVPQSPTSVAVTNTTITTTSATDVLVTGMTTTPAAGTYMVLFSGNGTNSTNNAVTLFSIYAGGSQNADSIRRVVLATASANTRIGFCCMGVVTVNGSQAIEGRWSTSGGSTGTVQERGLMVMRVG